MDKCIDEAYNYIIQARELGVDFDRQIAENELIVAYKK